MKLIPFEPGDLLERVKQQLHSFFGIDSDFIPELSSKIEVNDTEVFVRWKIPPCDDIQVYVDEQCVTIRGVTKQFLETAETKVSYSGQFSHRLQLPVKVRGERAQSTYQDGVLEIRINKQ
ncbi:MAG TPA: Hsp20/alpha crystallin family protein [Candidatus Deferrimicrobium sp.]|nr:Hsp20/alpha crystallin family protein [Candidatus Deferrimicrobium sp.]